jgi:hypothetical protein
VRLRVFALVAGFSACSVACSALVGFDYLVGDPGSDASPESVSCDAGVCTVAEGSVVTVDAADASTTNTTDASSDDGATADAADGATLGYCASQPAATTIFCADFDESADPTAGFTSNDKGANTGCQFQLGSRYTSPSHSLHVTTQANNGDCALIFDTGGGSFIVSVKALFPTLPPVGSTVTPVSVYQGGGDRYLQVSAQSTTAFVEESDGDGGITTYPNFPIDAGVWHAITINMDPQGGGTATFSVYVDGIQRFASKPTAYPWFDEASEVWVGQPNNDGDPHEVFIDNVVVHH